MSDSRVTSGPPADCVREGAGQGKRRGRDGRWRQGRKHQRSGDLNGDALRRHGSAEARVRHAVQRGGPTQLAGIGTDADIEGRAGQATERVVVTVQREDKAARTAHSTVEREPALAGEQQRAGEGTKIHVPARHRNGAGRHSPGNEQVYESEQ